MILNPMKLTASQLRAIIKEEVAREAERAAAGRHGRTMAQELEDIDQEIIEYLRGVFAGPVDKRGLILTHLDDDTVQLTTRKGQTEDVSVYDMEQVHGVALSQLEMYVEDNGGTVE